MTYILKNATIFINNEFKNYDLLVKKGVISLIGVNLQGYKIIDCTNQLITPSFVDLHVHSRTPGFEYKEDFNTLTNAALRGGFTSLITMPNINPVPDNISTLKMINEHIKNNTMLNVIQSGSITKNRAGSKPIDMAEIAQITNFISDDGSGISDDALMHQCLKQAQNNDLTMLIHPEVLSLTNNGCISVSEFGAKHGLLQINPEAEELMIGRDLILNQRINAKLHFCHVSTKNGVNLILKLQTPNTTFEVAPHHLVLSTNDLKNDGNYKMNPPLRSKEDVDYLVKCLGEEKINIIATDHAPHAANEKNTTLEKAMCGIIGLETCFPLLYTKLVLTNKVSLKHLINCLTINPGKILGIEPQIKIGSLANLCVLDLKSPKIFTKEMIGSKSHNTPFIGEKLQGYVTKTIYNGNILYEVNNEI